MIARRFLPFLGPVLLAACAAPPAPVARTGAPIITPAPAALAPLPPGANRSSGAIPAAGPPRPSASYAPAPAPASAAPQAVGNKAGDISLDFADTDIRSVAEQILGGILHVNYTIDPGVTGTATLRTVQPLTRAQLIPTLQTLLSQNNAVLVQSGGLYRVMPVDKAGSTPALAAGPYLGGSAVVPLRYTSATQLAEVLKPYVTKGGAILADPDSNTLIVQGDPATRAALTGLIEAFDVDALAGQSYELFPSPGGDAADFASAFKAALARNAGAKSTGPISIVPLERIGAVLVIARAPEQLHDAARVYAVLDQMQRETVRRWHVYYLRNSRANDAAYLLQEAFTPDDVTATPTPAKTQSAAFGQSSSSTGSTGAASSTGDLGGSTLTGASSSTDTGQSAAGTAAGTSGSGSGSAAAQNSTAGASALLGPLSQSAGNAGNASGIRIIPDIPNNALLIYATAQEDDEIEGMLAKLDIVPLEVRIDATIAEVDLTGALQYGTQYFFKSGDINAVLSNATTDALETNFPGFVLSGNGSDAAPLALSALESVTKVRVLSAPELMVLDGQSASLQVGDLVPYLTQTSESTDTSSAPVINSIDYHETGVILRVTPHVGSDGMVTLDIDQVVSGVSPTITTTGLNSPTFTEREVTSRIAIQDGQTVGLAGLISDNDSRENSGLPGLKNIPLIGAAFGTQNNSRTREELLVLITPHVIRSQQQALDLTQDMEQQLPNAALVPNALQAAPFGGSADPDANWRPKASRQLMNLTTAPPGQGSAP